MDHLEKPRELAMTMIEEIVFTTKGTKFTKR